MSKHRTSAITAAATLVAVHVVLVTVRHGTQFASLWGNWTGAVSALLAAVVCWSAARSSGSFTRRGWRLVSLSLVLAFLNQFAYTYYFDYLHAPSAALWPSDILVFFWAVPAMMTFFLSPRDPEQWRPLAARLRFRAGLYSGACPRALAPLYPLPMAVLRASHVRSHLLCGSPLLRRPGSRFPRAGPAHSSPDRARLLLSAGSVLLRLRNYNQHHPLRYRCWNLSAGDLARSPLDR